MKDQHTKIKGYKDFDQTTIDRINEIKSKANEVEALIKKLEIEGDIQFDPRWKAIAITDLQKGFMCLIRSITQPDGF